MVRLCEISIGRGSIVGAAAIACVFATSSSAWATVEILHAFCTEYNCRDGETPQYPPIADSNGVLYGTTLIGGGTGQTGVAYALTPNGTGGYTFGVLHRFGGSQGDSPSSPLIIDTKGNLYGTTFGGGAYGRGTLFELKPNADSTTWTEVVRYSFCPGGDPCVDGKFPTGPLTYHGAYTGAPYDGISPLYGTNPEGGSSDNGRAGRAFQITRVAGQTTWKEKVIYNFCSQPNCADGASPQSGLVINAHGVLFGTTVNGGNGGPSGYGTVFKINPKLQTETVLYAFCSQASCIDGANPVGPLALDAKGHLYGTTSKGGSNGSGTVFRVAPSAPVPEVVLYNFCGAANCTDGAYPSAGVAIDGNGRLLGVSQYGGARYNANCDNTGLGCGVLYRFSPKTSKLVVLHSFCTTGQANCPDGAEPLYGTVFLDASGNVFGVASKGGAAAGGTVFEFTP